VIIFEKINIKELTLQILTQSQAKFTGRLSITTSKGINYSIYFGLGRVVWATGGSHPYRRWQRLLLRNIDRSQAQPTVRGQDEFESWDYHLLSILVKRNQIPLDQGKFIIAHILEEVLFDLHQCSVQAENIFSGRWDQGVRPSKQLVLPPQMVVPPEVVMDHVVKNWQAWQYEGIGGVMPDLAPIIKSPKELKQLIPSQVYQNLSRIIDGQRSLRDVALMMKLDLMKLVKVLFPYIQRGLISLMVVKDAPPPSKENTSTPPLTQKPNPLSPTNLKPANSKPATLESTPVKSTVLKSPSSTSSKKSSQPPLILCIDDSKQICEEMEIHLRKAGYRFLGLQDSVMALSTLLEVKPDFIFLDLIMPVANGYEICTQIRRISAFQDIPVVILTGNDGLVDRVRAKMVGATDFLSKPAKPEKLISTVQRYIKVSLPENY
jgi:two-component system, chemotaxis family, response regulator PixG